MTCPDGIILREYIVGGRFMKRIIAVALTVVMGLSLFVGCSKKPSLTYEIGDLDVGDEITYGEYKDEEIEWEIISRNFFINEGKVQVKLLSKYVLDCQPFNESGESSWEDSSLRKWLNSDFISEAFSEEEQKNLAETSYFNAYGDERFLSDRVYLMDNMWYRFRNEEAVAKPTKYAEEKGVDMQGDYCCYWGRDVITVNSANTVIDYGGGNYPMMFDGAGNFSIGEKKVDDCFKQEVVGVRPVIVLEVASEFSRKDIEEADIVTFGKNGDDPIEWIVAESSKDGLTLLARYAIDDKAVDTKGEEEFEDTELYAWLNGEFYKKYFTRSEAKLMVEIDSDCYATLMSRDEITDAIHGAENFKYEVYTGYCPKFYKAHPELKKKKLVQDQKIIDQWWLRDEGKEDGTFVTFNMSQMFRDATAGESKSVRPVIRVKI